MEEPPRIIDNERVTLEELFKTYIKRFNADTWRFATGFLFLNGWDIVKEALPNTLKDFYILFGFIDVPFAKSLERVLERQARDLTDEALSELVDGRTLDRLFKEDKLHLRWIERLHSKFYLFTRNEDDPPNFDGKAIIGSSNVTRRGLREEGEFNIFLTDKSDLRQLLDWFRRKWEEAEDLTPEILKKVLINEKLRRNSIRSRIAVDPAEYNEDVVEGYLFLFWYLLNGIYDIEKLRKTVRVDLVEKLAKHNRDAVLWGYQIIKKYGGVILADPVGLGKSFQALGIIAALRSTENINKVLLVVPPHLIENEQWPQYVREFFGRGENGIILASEEEKVVGTFKSRVFYIDDGRDRPLEILFMSSYRLALLDPGAHVIDVLSDYDVIVVDEAHRFKDISSKRRVVLNSIIDRFAEKHGGRNPYVVLLTATPIVNDISELMSLVSIFARERMGDRVHDFGKLAKRRLEENPVYFAEQYATLVKECLNELDPDRRERACRKKNKEVAPKLRRFLKEILIMRSRSYIERTYYPNAKTIRPKLHGLNYVFDEKTRNLLEILEKLTLAYTDLLPTQIVVMPKITIEQGRIAPANEAISLNAVMKILLAKRLESSAYAFLRTLRKIEARMKELRDAVHSRDIDEIAKIVVAQSLVEAERGLDEHLEVEEAMQEKIEEVKNHLMLVRDRLPEIARNIDSDISIVQKLLLDLGIPGEIEPSCIPLTYKEKLLLDLLEEHVIRNGKKVVIFTMYVDTADRLQNILQKTFGPENIFKITGEMRHKRHVIEKFREVERGILISTDTLSEGVNLEFVDILVNYDIPWTPSVLMQRVGRLWRFGRRTQIHFYNFLPPEELTRTFTSVISRIEQKLAIIRDILVQEIALLREGEEFTEDFEERVYGNVTEKGKYGVKRDLMELLRIVSEHSAGELGILEAKLLEMVNTLQYDG
ncbi:MAG: hypothetical protein DRP97_07030, partial [Candidatus Latescibacterota bacterium]